jgi:putative thioredoxin
MMNPNIVDVSQENAQQVLVEESQKRPVVVDIFADGHEDCAAVSATLVTLVNEYSGQFLLAKLNVADNQGIAQQLGVRALPTVMVFKDGQPVDGLNGPQTEPALRELLDKFLPKPWDLLFTQAQTLLSEGQVVDAISPLKEAYTTSEQRADIAFVLVHCYLELNRCAEAEAVLGNVKMADQDAQYTQLMSQLELKKEASKSPEIQALEAKLEQNPDDKESAYQLAVQYSQTGQAREALELLLGLLRGELNYADGAAKKTYQDVLATLGKGDALAVEFQRKLYTLLY